MRFSLRWLFIAVLLVSVSIVGLLNANVYFAGIARAGLILFLAFAILGGINSVGPRRAFWFGVAIVGWIYLGTTVLNHQWFGGNVLGQQAYRLLWSALGKEVFDPQQVRIGEEILDDGRVMVKQIEYVPKEGSFYIICESILNSLWAIIGGYVGVWFYGRRDPPSSRLINEPVN